MTIFIVLENNLIFYLSMEGYLLSSKFNFDYCTVAL